MKRLTYFILCAALFLLVSACAQKPAPTLEEPVAVPVPPAAYDFFYQSKNDEGLAALEEFLKTNPEHAEGIALRGAFKARQGGLDSALADANRALELNPNLGLGYAVRAFVRMSDVEKVEEAKADLEKALQLDPNLALAYSLRGKLYIDESEFEQAKADLGRAIELRPDYAAPAIYLGDALFGLDQYEEAIQQYDRALEISGPDGYLFYQRGIANLTLGRYEDVVTDMTNSIAADESKYAAPFVVRAIAYENLGESEKAFADYERALELGTNDPSVYNNLAYMILRKEDGDYQKALEYASKAVDMTASDDPTVLNTLALVYYRLGEYETAAQIFTTAIDLGEPFAYYGRGLTYQALGDKEKAMADFQEFLQNYPDEPESADAAARLLELQSAP